MPYTCSVPGCPSVGKADGNIKFHVIPKDGNLREKWLSAIKRSEKELAKRAKVCSKHFVESDFTITRLNYSMSSKNNPSPSRNTCEWKVLKPNAVPSLKLPEKSTIKIKISKKNSDKEIKIEEKERKSDNEKVKMPKRHVEILPRPRTQSRRAASKEALKQMQLLLDDEDESVEIPSDDDVGVIPVEPSPPPPPKKKYKLSHRKSSDGHDRDVIVLKSITNRNAENTLELDCWVEQLEEVQKSRYQKIQDEEKQLQEKLESLIKSKNAEVIHKGDLNTIIEITEQVQSAITAAQAPPPNLILNNNLGGAPQSYQLVMDPRLGLIVGAVSSPSATPPTTTPQKVYQGKVQVAQNLQQTPTTSNSQTPTTRAMRTRRGGAQSKNTAPPPPSTTSAPAPSASSAPLTRSVLQTRSTPVRNAPITRATPPTRSGIGTRATPPMKTAPPPVKPTPPAKAPPAAKATPPAVKATPPSAKATPPAKATQPVKPAPPPKVVAPVKPSPTAKKQTVVVPTPPATRSRPPAANSYSNVRPSENNVEGGLATGGGTPTAKKPVVDLTSEEGRSLADSREISFNKLQGKTYPSLVVVARPHLRVLDLSVDRPKLDAKVKSVLMHAPTKFTEWLIQQGLVRSEQKCSVHSTTQLKLGMYSDVSKFPYSGGYVWISECCPQRFVSVFSGSLFEGSPHPPMVILKLLYHWSCQTNIQNVTQWVKVDNLYVKGMFTWLRSICTVALQTHIRQLGGPGVKVEVGVISLGTTSQDGNQRQVKVEVLGILESNSKLIRLRAVEPQADGDKNYKKRFSKILEPIYQWVHPQSILVADLTVDKQTLHNMGFSHVLQSTSSEYGSNRQIMEYLRRIVPRMFQNTLSLLSRQIIQQFLDELVWREWFGTSSLQAFDNLVIHLSEQTRFDSGQSLITRLNKVAQNPFKYWAIPIGNSTKVVENAQKKQPRSRKPETPKVTQSVTVDVNRPPKSTSPDVPEQMVPLENYYYGTIDHYAKSTKIVLNMKCPFCKSLFNNNIQLMNHLFKHAHNVSQDAQLCRYCLTSVPTANDLLKHIATSHPAETKFDNGFVCLICETQYMNPFVLGKHMSKEHCPSELPYQCGTCAYRCSNHKQAIDHFYKQHDNGPTIQCPFCLKSTTVFSSSRNIVQNMNYFIQHLQKHQRKQFAKRCGKCNLWFVQKDVLRDHQMRMHVSQRGKNGLVPWNAPRNGVMVPKSKMDKYPGDADVINFGTLFFNVSKNLLCKECNTPMDTPKHFPSFESCQNPNCQYSTCCTNAMQEHNAKCSKNYNPVAEEKLPFEMFCICGYSNTDGNQMARHLAICERKSAYPSRNEAKSAIVTHSMLDVLGLVRKPEEGPSGYKKKPLITSTKKEPVENSTETSQSEMEVDVVETVAVEGQKDNEILITESDKAVGDTESEVEIIDTPTETIETVDCENIIENEVEETENANENVNKSDDLGETEQLKESKKVETSDQVETNEKGDEEQTHKDESDKEETNNKDESDKVETNSKDENDKQKTNNKDEDDKEEVGCGKGDDKKEVSDTVGESEQANITEVEENEKVETSDKEEVDQAKDKEEISEKVAETCEGNESDGINEEASEAESSRSPEPEQIQEEKPSEIIEADEINDSTSDNVTQISTEVEKLTEETLNNLEEVQEERPSEIVESNEIDDSTPDEVSELSTEVQKLTEETLNDVGKNVEEISTESLIEECIEKEQTQAQIPSLDIENIRSGIEEINDVISEKESVLNDATAIVEQLSPVNEMETSEVIQEKSSSLEPEITSDDIQNLISDVVGEKANHDINFDDVQNIDETPSMETETDITAFSTGEESQSLGSRQLEDVAMQISQDESMDIPDASNEVMESEVTPMETD